MTRWVTSLLLRPLSSSSRHCRRFALPTINLSTSTSTSTSRSRSTLRLASTRRFVTLETLKESSRAVVRNIRAATMPSTSATPEARPQQAEMDATPEKPQQVVETGAEVDAVSGFKIIHRFVASQHDSFPYTRADLTPSDTSSDAHFYSHPRFVNHIDDTAVSLLQRYYGSIISSYLSGDTTPAAATAAEEAVTAASTMRESKSEKDKDVVVLDLCSSWTSHYPSSQTSHLRPKGGLVVYGVGMNASELAANPFFTGNSGGVGKEKEKEKEKRWVVHDLNVHPAIPGAALGLDTSTAPDGAVATTTTTAAGGEVDAGAGAAPASTATTRSKVDISTLSVSIDYLTQPVEVLSSLLHATTSTSSSTSIDDSTSTDGSTSIDGSGGSRQKRGSVHIAVSNRCFPTKAIRRWLRIDEAERLHMVCEMLWWAGWREDIEVLELSDGSCSDPLWIVRASKPAVSSS